MEQKTKLSRIAIIPARAGSKGLKDKNIRNLCGKPLIAYTIDAAKKSMEFDKIFVSTDSQDYADIAIEYGAAASFLRTTENSTDTASSWDAVREVITRLEAEGEHYDEIMLLQATSPLRNEKDIKAAIRVKEEKEANAVESVTEMTHSPLWSNTLPNDGCMDQFERTEWMNIPRQKLPKFYRLNGAIYLLKREELEKEYMFRNKCYAYIMPPERSVDIDTEIDFFMAELIMSNLKVI